MSRTRKPRPLPEISAEHLLAAKFDGREVYVPYSTARTFAQRGWGEMTGTKTSRDWRSYPQASFRYSIEGLRAAAKLYRDRLGDDDVIKFNRSYNVTAQEVEDLAQTTPLETMIKAAQDLVDGLEERGHRAIASRGHLWALVEHQAAVAVKS